MRQSVRFFLLIQVIVNSLPLCTSQLSFVERWAIEQKELVKEIEAIEFQETEESPFAKRQNAVAQMLPATSNMPINLATVSSADMYKDGFDKIWDRQEQEKNREMQTEQERNYDELVRENPFAKRQNAVGEMLPARLNTPRALVAVFSADMYKDGFDKLWDSQEQELLQQQEKNKQEQMKQERYYNEPVRKRHRVEK